MEPWFVFLVVIFIGTGVMQPLLISTLGNLGAYDKSTLLFLLPNYVGMTLAAITRHNIFTTGTIRWKKMAILSSIDVLSQFLCQYGLAVAGSSLYIVIYSSCTMWIAVESRILIKRKLAAAQWLGCAIVVAGLAITGGNVASTFGDKSGADIALGASFILFGSVSHALTWVLVEMMLKGEVDPVLPEAISAIMGGAGVCVFGLWQLVYTLPRAEELVHQPIASHGGHIGEITTSYIVLTLASCVHAVTFYHLVGKMGCVTAGVMKGCQAVAVFIGSHVFFCGFQESQCFTTAKAWSLVLVVAGTTTYALSEGAKGNEVVMDAAEDDGASDSSYVKVEGP